MKFLNLSKREVDVVTLLFDGCSGRLIAERLRLTEQAVRYCLRNVYRKAEVKSACALVSLAFHQGGFLW